MTDGYAHVKPTTSDQYPLPAIRPFHPTMSVSRIKRVFGIEMQSWQLQLEDFLRDHAVSDAFRRVARRE